MYFNQEHGKTFESRDKMTEIIRTIKPIANAFLMANEMVYIDRIVSPHKLSPGGHLHKDRSRLRHSRRQLLLPVK